MVAAEHVAEWERAVADRWTRSEHIAFWIWLLIVLMSAALRTIRSFVHHVWLAIVMRMRKPGVNTDSVE